MKEMIDSAGDPFMKNAEWRPKHRGGPLREPVAILFGISASTIGRVTWGAGSAGGILVSPQVHGHRGRTPFANRNGILRAGRPLY